MTKHGRRFLLPLSLILLPGCLEIGATGGEGPIVVIDPPDTFSGDPRGVPAAVPATGDWYLEETFSGWIFFVQQLDGAGSAKYEATLHAAGTASASTLLVLADPVADKARRGPAIELTSGFSVGGLGEQMFQQIGLFNSPAEGSWVFFGAFASEEATVRLRLTFDEGKTHAWESAPLTYGEVVRKSRSFHNNGNEHRMTADLAQPGAVVVALEGRPREGAEQSLELIGHQPHRVSASGSIDGEANNGALDVAGLLAAPPDEYRALVHEEGNGGRARTMVVVSQTHDLEAWFFDTYGYEVHWSMFSGPNDQDFFSGDDGPP